ncbi:hypothetical protein LCGC14_1825940, partial [marine sediment metagenome]
MTEERTSIIEVGDIIRSSSGHPVLISRVEQGRYGCAIYGRWTDTYAPDHPYRAFLVPELLPCDWSYSWHGWSGRAFVTLPNGLQAGAVAWSQDGEDRGVEADDAKWENTIEAMKAEEGVMQSRPT